MHFAFAYFPFVLIHLEYETINTFIRSRSSLENHIRFQTKMGQSVYTFSDQKGPKTIPFRTAHTYMAYIRDPRPPDLGVGFCEESTLMESRGKWLKNKTNQLCVSALENSALKIESKKMSEEQQAPTLGAFWGAGMFTWKWGIPGRLPHLPGVRRLHGNRPLGGRRVETG